MEDSTTAPAEASSRDLIIAAVAVVVVLPFVLPFKAVVALACGVPAAIWWWSASQTHAQSSFSGNEQNKDEDLGLPPRQKSGPRSDAVSRKASVSAPQKLTQQAAAKAKQLQSDAGAAPPAAVLTAAAAGEPVVTLAVQSSPQKAAAVSSSVPAAVNSTPVPASEPLLPEPVAVATSRPASAAVAPAAAVSVPASAAVAPAAAVSRPASAAVAPAVSTVEVESTTPAVQPVSDQPVALTGSAAILAKLRSQRQSSTVKESSAAKVSDSNAGAAQSPRSKLTVVYASQTGTAQEIARTIQAEAVAAGMAADVMSFNELGFENLTAAKTPVVVFVASSTGDGDPPDNAAAAYVALKKPWPSDRLAGIKYTVLGLGDSNYTRFMHVPRAIKTRMQELGATCFYNCVEADEVDGLESKVDPWCEGIMAPLKTALQELQQPQQVPAADAASRGSTPAVASRQQSALSAEPTSYLLSAVMRDDFAAPSPGAGPRVQMELSAMSGASDALSGQASLLGEDSAASAAAAPAAETSQPEAVAAAPASRPESATTAATAPALASRPGSATVAEPAAPAAAVTAAAAAGTPPSTPPVQLVNGLAPQGVDLKGVPPLAPCRIVVNQQVSPPVAAAAKAKDAAPTMDQKFYRDPAGMYSAAAPFWTTVSDARLMTAESSDRTVIHVELDISDSGMRYNAGDAVGVLAQNAAPLVTGLLARLGLDGDTVFTVESASGESTASGLLSHVPWPCTLRYAFTNCTDLTSVPRKSLLRMLAEHCSDPDEQRTLLFFTSRAGREAYATEIAVGQPSVLDLLRRFPSCRPPVDAVLDALPPLAPRMYSLTNAPVAADIGENGHPKIPGACGPNKVQFAFSVVEFETQYGTRHGVATNWLARLVRPWLAGEVGPGTDPTQLPQIWVPIFLRRAGDFKPPKSLSTAMVMVGPGTGVAPFRGFLQQRLADMQACGESSPAPAVLYFGCRQEDEDYLYQQDWPAFQAAGTLQNLRVAFSRAQEEKVYVQHLMQEDASSIAKLIASGAHLYVCGDGAAMAKDVHATLIGVLCGEMGMTEAAAAEELMAMAKAGRYVRDIWS